MDCELRVIKGPDAGQRLKLAVGQTLVGKSAAAGLRLTDTDASWEHAVVIRAGEDYFLENLSAHGTFLDGQKITAQVKLKPRDEFRVGLDSVIRLEPADAAAALIARRRLLIGLVVALVLGLVTVLIVQAVNNASKKPDDWAHAYGIVEPWLKQQAARRALPVQLHDAFVEAWRLEQNEDYKSSQVAWLRVQMLLDNQESKVGLIEKSATYPMALEHMLNPRPYEPDATDDQIAAAVVQYANRRLAWSTKQTKSTLKLLGS